MKKGGSRSNKGNDQKRVRFDLDQNTSSNSKSKLDEVDLSDGEGSDFEKYLEPSKQRRGAVNLDGLREGEGSSDEEDYSKPDTKPDNEADDDDMFDIKPTSSKTINSNSKSKHNSNPGATEELLSAQEKVDKKFSLGNKDVVEVEPFNFDEDMEEGKFDDNGNFVWNAKDPNLQHDSWLKDVNEEDIEKARIAKANRDKGRNEGNGKEKEKKLDLDSLVVEEIKIHLANLIKPKQSIVQTISKLGDTLPKKNKRNNQNKKKIQADVPLTQKQIENKKKIELLTELSNYLVNKGIYDIYQETYESLVRAARFKDLIQEDWEHGEQIPIRELEFEAED